MVDWSPIAAVTGEALYVEYLLESRQDRRAWILVEGPDDCTLIDCHLNLDHYKTVAGGSKRAVLEARQHFIRDSVRDVFCVVDRDFDELSETAEISVSARYDLEAEIMLENPLLMRRLIRTHCRRPSAASSSEEILGAVRAAALAVGAMRFCVRTWVPGVKTAGFPVGEMLSAARRGSALAQARRVVATRSPRSARVPIVPELRAAILSHGISLISGHDLLRFLAAAIREAGGVHLAERTLRAALQSSVDCRHISGASLFGGIMEWGLAVRARSPWDEACTDLWVRRRETGCR